MFRSAQFLRGKRATVEQQTVENVSSFAEGKSWRGTAMEVAINFSKLGGIQRCKVLDKLPLSFFFRFNENETVSRRGR